MQHCSSGLKTYSSQAAAPSPLNSCASFAVHGLFASSVYVRLFNACDKLCIEDPLMALEVCATGINIVIPRSYHEL